MKKLITIFILLFSITTFSQNEIKNDSISTTESFETIIKSYLTKTLDFVEQEGKKVYDLASVEIPEVIKQYLLFEAINYWLLCLIFITPLLFYKKIKNVVLIKSDINPEFFSKYSDYYYKEVKDGYWLLRDKTDATWAGFWYYTGSFLVCTLPLIGFFINLLLAIKVTFFPKLYLVEKFINIL